MMGAALAPDGKSLEGPDSTPCPGTKPPAPIAPWPFERHVKFSGSQLEEALALHKTVNGDKFLTLQIGSNDELNAVGDCRVRPGWRSAV